MFKLNENLKPGQQVLVKMPIFGTFKGTVDEVAPEFSSSGDKYAAAEYGVTVRVEGTDEVLWAFQEDVTILKEAK